MAITASGMAAIMLMCFSLLKAGDHVVFSQSMFGSTIKLIGTEFGVRWSPPSSRRPDLAAPEGCRAPQHPAAVCRDTHQPADRTRRHRRACRHCAPGGAFAGGRQLFATPVLQQPLRLGADIVMHPAPSIWMARGA